MRIYVTQEDIDKGCRADSFGCPIARAMRRITGARYSVSYDGADRINGKPFHVELPVEAIAFIRNFDLHAAYGNKVKPVPFHFDIDLREFEPVPTPEPVLEPVLELVPEPVLEEELELVGV